MWLADLRTTIGNGIALSGARLEVHVHKARINLLVQRIRVLASVIAARDSELGEVRGSLRLAEEEIAALRKGTTADGAAEDRDTAIGIIEGIRRAVNFDPDRSDEELEEEIRKRLVHAADRIAEHAKSESELRRQVATLERNVHRLARDGVDGTVRYILHATEHETGIQAAHRIMGELSAAVRRVEELEAMHREDHATRDALAGVVGNGAG